MLDTIKDIARGEFEFTEDFINDYISKFAQDYSIKLHDGYFVLNTPDIEARLDYDSCRFKDGERSMTFKVLDLKPFHYKMFLRWINKKLPFMEYGKDAENTKLITCHLDKIPKLKDNKILNNSYLEHATIDYIKCEDEKVTVKLKLKSKLSEIFRDLASGLEIRVVEHALPVGSKWLKRMDKIFANLLNLGNSKKAFNYEIQGRL